MREIRFRQWNDERKRFHYWGFLNGPGCFTGPIDVNCDNEQFTGLHDKDGREIYEGDVIKFTKGNEITEIGNFYSEAGIRVVRVLPETQQLGWPESGYTFCKRNCETIVKVIGDIHSNPDLLEVSKHGT